MRYVYFVEDIEIKNHQNTKAMELLDDRGRDGYRLVQVLLIGDNYRYFYEKKVGE